MCHNGFCHNEIPAIMAAVYALPAVALVIRTKIRNRLKGRK